MMRMRRRQIIGLVATSALLCGCLGREESPETPSPTPAETGNPPTGTSEESTTPSRPESCLPPDGNGWELRGTSEHDPGWTPLGATDGTIGHYTGPNGLSYDFIVMISRPDLDNPEGLARSLACAGWQVTLAIDTYAIAASTGTEQRTFTPERPPTMTETAVPNSEDTVVELVERSPCIRASEIEQYRVSCEY
jgi:hypothetical protein